MTDKKLKELLIVIDNRYGRVRSKEDRIIDLKTCVQASIEFLRQCIS